ncbi:sulfotransferase family cytosolic 1B member 1-like [Strongylocentrotus purpuratus]|uniref:Sulfotransferase domain-containing protein n=1 Tax=Strongylocentrotus purpuratus TaxID=7668 RepID=A0A7M7PA90_STRPU|nr:sulfotransferase family cytosolic 1B member 1-like [Strongylocentrotus purpuratus]
MAQDIGPEVVISPSRTVFQVHKGVTLPNHVLPEVIEDLQSFKFRPDDIIIVTSPKSGTHWVSETTGLIMAYGVWENVKRDTLKNHLEFALINKDVFDESIPFVWFYKQLDKMPSPRIMFTHLPLEFLPPGVFDVKAKIIYCARNPKDTVTSMFRFVGHVTELQCKSFPEFYGEFFTDQWLFGAWDRHVLSYWNLKNEDNFLFLKYEDMKKTPGKIVTQISEFIDHPVSDDVRDVIVEKTSIDKIKKEMKRLEKAQEEGYLFSKAFGRFSYYQKGVIGDWKNYFTVAQSDEFDKEIHKRLGESGLEFDYE